MKLEGREVVIKCGGTTMREYRPTVSEDGEEITCYIATKPGEEFYIEYSHDLNFGPSGVELCADVYLGGVFDGPGWIAPDPLPGRRKVIGEIWGSRRGEKIHQYTFSNPDLIDGETPSSIDPDRIGELEVRLGFTHMAQSKKVKKDPHHRSTPAGPAKVNEKDKKPGVHCAGPKSEAYAEECTEQIFFGRSLDALAFIFMCRSEEWLQAEGIARKPRRKGRAEPAEDSTLPKPEPIEEVTPIRDITGGNKPAVGSKERTRPVLKRTRADSVAPLERAHKIPKRSKNSRISTPTGNGAAEKDSQWSKLKAEEGSSGLKVKEEMTEVKVEDLEETKGMNKVSRVKKEESLQPEVVTFKGRTRSPKVKIEGE